MNRVCQFSVPSLPKNVAPAAGHSTQVPLEWSFAFTSSRGALSPQGARRRLASPADAPHAAEPSTVPASIFLDFNPAQRDDLVLPVALLLAVALFFKFNRLLSLRNWDLLTLLRAVRARLCFSFKREQTAWPLAESVPPGKPAGCGSGYLWLLAGSAYFFVRWSADLALVRRPALDPNLNLAGLAWLTGTLFICLGGAAVRKPVDADSQVGKGKRRSGGARSGGSPRSPRRRPANRPMAAAPASGSSVPWPVFVTSRSCSPSFTSAGGTSRT